jgi:hypothetical protein
MSNIESVYNNAILTLSRLISSDLSQNNRFITKNRCFSSSAARENDCQSIRYIGFLANSRHNNFLKYRPKCNYILEINFPPLLIP